MTLKEFTENLDRYGADLTSWPASIGEAAQQLLENSREAATRHHEAVLLDELLEALPVNHAPSGLASRIVDEIANDPWQRLVSWFSASFWRPTLAGALSLGLGIAIGMSQAPRPEIGGEPASLDDFGLFAFSTEFEELPYVE